MPPMHIEYYQDGEGWCAHTKQVQRYEEGKPVYASGMLKFLSLTEMRTVVRASTLMGMLCIPVHGSKPVPMD